VKICFIRHRNGERDEQRRLLLEGASLDLTLFCLGNSACNEAAALKVAISIIANNDGLITSVY